MLIDPIGTYEQARARHEELAKAAALESEIRAQLPPSGPRVAIAAILRRLADRIDIDRPAFESLESSTAGNSPFRG